MSKIIKQKRVFQRQRSKQFKGWQDGHQQVGVIQIMTLLDQQKNLLKFSQHMYGFKNQNFIKNKSNKIFKNKTLSPSKIRKASFHDYVKPKQYQNQQKLSYIWNEKQNEFIDKIKRRSKVKQRAQLSQSKINYNIIKHNKMKSIDKKKVQSERNKNNYFNHISHNNSSEQFKISKKLNQDQIKVLKTRVKSKSIKVVNNIQKIYEKIMNCKQSNHKMKTQSSSGGAFDIRKNMVNTVLLKGKQINFQNTFRIQRSHRKAYKTITTQNDKINYIKRQITDQNLRRSQRVDKNYSLPFDKLNTLSVPKKDSGKYQYNNGKIVKKQNNSTIFNQDSIFLFGDGQIFDQLLQKKEY